MTAFRLRSLVCLAGALALGAQEPEVRSFGQQQDVYPAARDAAPRRESRPQPKPQPQPQQQPQDDMAAPPAPNLDKHYIQKDEYLVAKESYKPGNSWIHVFIAKMVTPPSAETKQEAEFFIVSAHMKGEKIWTKNYQLTRPATREDLKLGAVAYALDANREDDIYVGPKNRKDNLDHPWFAGTINDDSEMYKGFITMSGYKIKPSGLRVAIAK